MIMCHLINWLLILMKVNNVKKSFNTINGEIEAIKNIDLEIKDGEFIAIVGPSGCGKSTLLSILANLEEASSGNIIYDNSNPKIGYMLQDDALLDHLTIMDNACLGLKILHLYNDTNVKYVEDLLDKYDLLNFKDKHPYELSGGMKQRVALIRTLAIKPDILFLDEPFSALDYTTRLNVSNDVFQIIKSLNKTTIMVSHDIAEAISMADRVVVLSKSPATIKNIYTINIKGNNLLERRKDENFNNYYESILKDMDYV